MTLLACLMLLTADAPLTARVVDEKPPAFADLLDGKAIRVAAGRDTAMTFWFRKTLPSNAAAEQFRNGLTYREIPVGTLVGVVRFPATFTDYRKQEIAAGDYTLRLGFQPEIGDHTGTAPHTEFLLLSPLADDTSPDEIEADALRKLSAKTTGGDHPAVLLLYPRKAAAGPPKVVEKSGGVSALTFSRRVEGGAGQTDLGVALVVRGWSVTR